MRLRSQQKHVAHYFESASFTFRIFRLLISVASRSSNSGARRTVLPWTTNTCPLARRFSSSIKTMKYVVLPLTKDVDDSMALHAAETGPIPLSFETISASVRQLPVFAFRLTLNIASSMMIECGKDVEYESFSLSRLINLDFAQAAIYLIDLFSGVVSMFSLSSGRNPSEERWTK